MCVCAGAATPSLRWDQSANKKVGWSFATLAGFVVGGPSLGEGPKSGCIRGSRVFGHHCWPSVSCVVGGISTRRGGGGLKCWHLAVEVNPLDIDSLLVKRAVKDEMAQLVGFVEGATSLGIHGAEGRAFSFEAIET